MLGQVRSVGVNQQRRLASKWGHDPHDPRPIAVVRQSCAAVVEATDFSVASPVINQFDELAGGGDFADVVAAAGPDPVTNLAQATVLIGALDGFDCGPAHQPAALFGDGSAMHGGVGLVVFGG